MRKKPDYFYLQSAVIPFRRRQARFEILLISSRKKKRWVLPKGVQEPGMTARESAVKEALEEAGISGDVSTHSIGTYDYPKWGGTCTVQVFPMEVQILHDTWEENFRDREWMDLEEAISRVDEDALKELTRSLPDFLEP